MTNDNGHQPRLTLGQRLQNLAGRGPRPDVPIVGLPFELQGWFVQILLMCKCEQPKPVLLIGQAGSAAGLCPGCGKTYTLLSIGVNPAGQPAFNVGVSTSASAPSERSEGEDHG